MNLKFILPIIVAVIFFGVWGCLAFINTDLNVLPGPIATWKALWADRGALFAALGVDTAAMLLGFFLAVTLGVLTSIALMTYQGLRLAFAPWVTILRMAPIITLAPIAIIAPVSSFVSVLIVTMLACFFPVVYVATPALMATDKPLLDLFTTYRASYWQEITMLRLPHALPQLLTAIKRAAIYAPMAAIVTDYLAGLMMKKPGLGQLLGQYIDAQNYAGVTALCILAALTGVVMAGTVHAISYWTLMHWHDNEHGHA
ncbi:ABC transporter permease [Cerasicoccus maritimus]|uniref:ABC transporter permease n=1 Tax=Cerasicoccus maritimus TaxID=490089 RepID=UPI002852BEA5|nr:ABC transporter permease subunit [Cerasicoccus maritimus]